MAQVAELPGGAPGADEDDLVLSVVIGSNEMPFPAASFRISASSALDASELGGNHGQDDADNDRHVPVSDRDRGLHEIQLAAAAFARLRGPRHERAAKTLIRLL